MIIIIIMIIIIAVYDIVVLIVVFNGFECFCSKPFMIFWGDEKALLV